MRERISRRTAFMTVVGALLSPLAAKGRAAVSQRRRAGVALARTAALVANGGDASGAMHVTSYSYDELGRLVSVVNPTETCE